MARILVYDVVTMVENIKQAKATEPAPSGQEAEKKVRTSQTLLRGLDIIEAVAGGAVDIASVAQETGMTYSTTHRMLSVLQSRHYIKREAGGRYLLGRKLLELGYRAYSQVDLTRLARPKLVQLAEATRDTVHLGWAEGDLVIYLDKVNSQRPVEISSRIGASKPLISTGIGKALLLDHTEAQWKEVYERGADCLREPVTWEQWRQIMRDYAAAGYSYDLGEDEQSIRCVAAPIRDSSKRIVAAISVSSTVEHMEPDRMRDLVAVVQQAARKISIELGGNAS